MRLRSFRKSQDGVAAVEFALILPVMLLLFFGVVESSMALLCRADVSIMSSTAADLIAQESSTNTADLNNVYAAAGTVLYPYYTGGTAVADRPTIRLTSIVYDSTKADPTKMGALGWTCTRSGNGTLPAMNLNFTESVLSPGGSVLVAEVAYSYSSPTTQVITGGINMTNTFYTKPRRVAQIPTPVGGCP